MILYPPGPRTHAPLHNVAPPDPITTIATIAVNALRDLAANATDPGDRHTAQAALEAIEEEMEA